MKQFVTILKGIWEFLNSRVFLYILLAMGVILILRTCSKLEKEERAHEIDQQNIIALNDSLKIEKTKSGKLQASIAGYVSDINNLKDLNKDLYNDVKDQKGKVLSLNKLIFQLRQDTAMLREHINYLESIMSQPIPLDDSTFQMSWILKYDWDKTNFDVYNGQTIVQVRRRTVMPLMVTNFKLGYSRDTMSLFRTSQNFNDLFELNHIKTEIVDRLSQVELTFGQKIEDKQLRVFVNTNYPGFTATSLQGVLIDPATNPFIKELMDKPKLFPNTWSLGVGGSTGFNFLTGKPYLGIGINVTYNLFEF